MKIAITGSSGFVGKHMVEALSSQHSVLALNRAAIGDFMHVEDWAEIFAGCDAVVHLAGRVNQVNERSQNHEDYQQANVGLSKKVLKGAIEAGVRDIVFLSTAAVYDVTDPNKEEQSELLPPNAYGQSKADAECLFLNAQSKIRPLIIRPPLIYGKGGGANIMMLKKAIEKGLPLPLGSVKNSRSILHVRNLCDFILYALESEDRRGIYNIADTECFSTPMLIKEIGAAIPRSARLFWFPPVLLKMGLSLMGYNRQITGLISSFVLNTDKVRATGWIPPFTFQQGIREMLKS